MSETHVLGRRGMRNDMVRKEVDKLAAELSLPDSIRADSERICEDILAKNVAGRRSPPIIAASSLYTACRERHNPVTLKDLAQATDSDPTEIGRTYRAIINSMNIAPPNLNGAGYTHRVAETVKASKEATDISQSIVKTAIDKGLGGRNPMTLAAAAVYLACLVTGENSRQSDVAEAACVSEVSVRECIKAIRRVGAV